jgi:DHA1 family bicyclomycin/chloramphenicol resistance-like MFS transporter
MVCCAAGAFTVLALGRNIVCRKARKEAVEEEDVEMMSTL